jgi:outer membrane beta-barrel protein
MKRPAICLFVWVAIVGWAATGHAKKGSSKAGGAAPADTAAASGGGDAAPAAADQQPADTGAAPAADSPEPGAEEAPAGKVEEEIGGPKGQRAASTLTWQDIVVVPRKSFIKSGRLELAPFSGLSVNDNLIRHYMFGVDLNYFLTDVFSIGLQGQYFVKQLTNQDELIGLQYNRTPTLNRYLYGAALNFGYVPVYGKFAWFNRSILHWEILASAGVGATITETIPRDPANAALAFKYTALTPNVGIGGRFFLFDWLTINVALRDYIMADKFEHVPDTATTSAQAKTQADSALVNNLMVYAGIGIYLPTKFTYRTPQ